MNLANGSMSYDSPASISVGSGGFPYEISAGFSFHQGAVPTIDFGPIFPGSPAGWTGSWDNSLSLSSSGMEGMGVSDVRAAAATIAAFAAEQDVYKASPSVARDVAAALTQAWLTHQFAGNTASATVGGATRQFVKLADGSWVAPGAGYATLTQTGTRAPFTYVCPAPHTYSGANYALSRGWDASGLSFTVTNAAGDAQNFGYWQQHYDTSADKPDFCGRASGFRMDTWTFPQGMTVTLGYGTGTTYDGTANSSSPNATYAYPNNPFPLTVSNGLGRTLTFGTDGTTYQPTVTDGNGRTLTGPSLGVASTTDPFGTVTNFHFNNAQVWSATTRPVPYNQLGQVFTPYTPSLGSDPHTVDLQYDYDALGQVYQVRDAVNLQVGGRSPWSFYIADSTRGERDDPLGNGYTVVYDTHRHPVRYIDELGGETDATIDSRGRVTSYTYPLLDKELFAYDDHNNTTSFTRVAKPGSGLTNLVVTATFDSTWNKPLTITNAKGVTTTFTYYASGSGKSLMATAVRPADGYGNGTATYSFTYTSIGKPLTATDPDGVAMTNAYDSYANLTSTTVDPSHLALATLFGYDAIGNKTSTTDARGYVTTSIFDADRRKTESDSHNGNAAAALLAASQSVYEAHGWVTDTKAGTAFSGTSVTTWLVTAHSTYTPTGKVATVTDADSRTVTTSYDALDRVGTVTDPIGRAVHSNYDAAGELLVEYRGWGSPLQEAYATHHYTTNGKEDSVYDALGATHTTSYTYDGFDRLVSTVFADASHEDMTYDKNSNVRTRLTRAGQTLSYAYDTLDRMRVKTIPASSANAAHTITTALSLAGRTSSLTDSAGPAISYSFDTAGRATSEVETVLGTARTVGWQLDAMGNHTRLTWPDSYAVNYAYDALGRMSTATVNGGSQLAAYTYDALSRRTNLSYNSGTSSTAYTYTNAGDMLTLANDFSGTTNDVIFTDTYTNAHQLASEGSSNSAYVWVSPNTGSGDTYAAVNNLNQYPTVNGGSLTWDGNGNLATMAGITYSHNPENRMVQARGTGTGALMAIYTYDPLGRRVAKSVDPHTGPQWGTPNWNAFSWTALPSTVFVHDGDNEIAEYDQAGTLVRRFVPGAGIDQPIAMVTAAGATTFFHTDRKGSIIAMADTSGARVEGPYTYDAYGNCFVGASTTNCTTSAMTTEPFRYTGQRFDPETGLYYYRARFYHPGIGRFAETDPVGYGPDINWYAYTGNDPTDKSDPSGKLVVWKLMGGATQQQVDAAIKYLSGSAAYSGPYKEMSDSPEIITILVNAATGVKDSNHTGRFKDENGKGTGGIAVIWNPRNQLSNKAGDRQSSAVGLGHELIGHAYRDFKNHDQYLRDLKEKSNGITIDEIKATAASNAIARQLGEPQQHDYNDVDPTRPHPTTSDVTAHTAEVARP